jgi:hypothetical protein
MILFIPNFREIGGFSAESIYVLTDRVTYKALLRRGDRPLYLVTQNEYDVVFCNHKGASPAASEATTTIN